MSTDDTTALSADDSALDTASLDLAEVSQAQQTLDVIGPETATGQPDDEDEGLQALRELERKRKEHKRKRRIKIAIACAIAGGIIAITAGRSFFGAKEQVEEYAPEMATVERGDFQNIISASGALKAGSTVVVTPEVDGIIETISVAEGQYVNAGDILFTLKNDSLDKAIRDAQQEVQSAQQALASAQTGVSQANAARDDAWSRYYEEWGEADAAHRQWEDLTNNYSSLHADWERRKREADALACGAPVDPGAEPSYPAVGDENYDEKKKVYDDWQKAETQFLADTELYKAYLDALALVGDEPQPAGIEPSYPDAPDDTSLIAAIQSAQDGVSSANLGLQRANEALDETVKNAEKRTVKAPISGNVVAVGAKVGEAVGSAQGGTSDGTSSGTLVQISDVNKMAIDIEVNEIDILNVKPGQHATVTFSAVPNVEVDALVTEVATVASGTGEGGGIVTFHVGLVIDKPDSKLRPGMTASVKIYTVDVKDVLLVPVGALNQGSDGTYSVDVVTDAESMTTMTKTVTVGERSATEAVITSGLEEGETVLVGNGMGMDEYAAVSFEG